MTYQNEFTPSEALLEQRLLGQIAEGGLPALPELFRVLLNAAMQLERQRHIGAAPPRVHRGPHPAMLTASRTRRSPPASARSPSPSPRYARGALILPRFCVQAVKPPIASALVDCTASRTAQG